MNATKKKPARSHLYSTYQRIKHSKYVNGKPLCCKEWVRNSRSFYKWYERQVIMQNGLCKYCGLPGKTTENYSGYFRKGRRGRQLEVDRIENDKGYSPQNCVLACYPCNNAKSDVFSYEEFLEIGKTIGNVKKQKAFRGDLQ
jgi:5-methylcytosine-specific restriction endonuclease McrA